MKSDNLEFNEVQLGSQIRALEEVRDALDNLKSNYLEYINEQLSQNWTTDSGVEAIETLRQFAYIDITNFITYFNGRISDLQSALQNVKNINAA